MFLVLSCRLVQASWRSIGALANYALLELKARIRLELGIHSRIRNDNHRLKGCLRFLGFVS